MGPLLGVKVRKASLKQKARPRDGGPCFAGPAQAGRGAGRVRWRRYPEDPPRGLFVGMSCRALAISSQGPHPGLLEVPPSPPDAQGSHSHPGDQRSVVVTHRLQSIVLCV